MAGRPGETEGRTGFSALGAFVWNSLRELIRVLHADANELLLPRFDPVQLSAGTIEPVPAPQAPTPPGVVLAYDVAAKKLEESLQLIDQLDTKAGVIIGALVAAGALDLATGRGVWVHVVVGVPLIIALGFATFAFLVRRYEDAPDVVRFASAAAYQPDYMKEVFLRNVLDAVQANRAKAAKKGLYLNWSVGVASTTAAAAILAKMTGAI
jgi:hypothetical protein